MARIRVFTTEARAVRDRLSLPADVSVVEVDDLSQSPAGPSGWPPDWVKATAELEDRLVVLEESRPHQPTLGLAGLDRSEIQDAIAIIHSSGLNADIVLDAASLKGLDG